MADIKLSSKRIQIDKANATVVAVVGIAAFVIVASLVFSRALLVQRSYQSKVISAQNKAKKQLKENIDNVSSLKTQYQAFADQAQNIIGGSSKGSGDHDGDNAKIVLDALPSKYDFPALATSLDKMLSSSGAKVTAITGTDDEVAQNQNSSTQTVEIPFTATVEGSYQAIQSTINLLEKSIRPFKMTTFEISGSDNDLTAAISASTYYQPAKTLNIKQQEVKP